MRKIEKQGLELVKGRQRNRIGFQIEKKNSGQNYFMRFSKLRNMKMKKGNSDLVKLEGQKLECKQ